MNDKPFIYVAAIGKFADIPQPPDQTLTILLSNWQARHKVYGDSDFR